MVNLESPLKANSTASSRAHGPYEPPFYNFWHHLFTPDKVDQWGETVRVELPASPIDREALRGHYDDFEAAIAASIHTCDADVLGELLERQADFPKMWNRANEKAFTRLELLERQQDFLKMWNRANEKAFTRLAENGIFTSDTPSADWQTVHGLFPRGFNQLKIQNAYFPIIVKKTNAFVAEWSRFEPAHLVTGVNNWLACMTADAVIKAACNVDMDNIARRARGEPAHPILETFRRLGSINPALAKPWQVVGLANFLNPFYDTKAGQERMYSQLKGQLQGMVEQLIEQTRRGELGDTLLSSLISEKSPATGLYVRQSLLFSHFATLLVAGHETTANTMGFLMYHLSQNPKWEERLRAEIREVLGGRTKLAASDIPRLVVAEACFKEALRLHPPAGNVGRDAAHDTVLKGQYLVRRGQRISVNLVALHRQPRHWGGEFGDPNTFNPARFMPGAAEAAGRHPHAFKPFGFGVRACAGMQFAMWEAKTLIPMLYHNFTFRLVEKFMLRPSRKESFPSPSAEGLALYIYPAPGAPAAAAAAGFAATAATLDSIMPPAGEQPQLPKAGAVLFVTSTYNGEPPDNALRFAKWLPAAAAAAAAAGGAVEGLPFAVLGVGNSQWATYQAFPRLLDSCLAAAGGLRLAPVIEADTEAPGFADAAGECWGSLCPLLLAHFKVAAPSDSSAAAAAAASAPRLLLEAAGPATPPLTIREVLGQLRAYGRATGNAAADQAEGNGSTAAAAAAAPQGFPYDLLRVVSSEELQAPGSGRFTRHVDLELPQGMSYAPGDHLEVLPRNAPALVDSALELLQLTGHEAFWWTPSSQGAARGLSSLHPTANPSSSSPATNTNRTSNGPAAAENAASPAANSAADVLRLPVSSRDVLAWLVDLSALPPMRLVAALAAECPCPPEAAALQRMATEACYKEQVLGQQLTLLELLARHRSLLAAGLDLPRLAGLLPRLAPRYYSISSSPAGPAGPQRASITVALVEFSSPTGRLHRGAASGTIHGQQVGLYLAGTVRQLQSRFRLPPNPATPLIMVGPGTGVAPFMGFLQQRAAQQQAGAALGPAVLFFGCRTEQDFLYQQQLQAWQENGVLTDLQVAFSRLPGKKQGGKTYVQDLIAESAQQLWELLHGSGAYVYVCGDARRMAPDVRAAFEGVACGVGGLDAAAAAEWMREMRQQGRYLEDVWAS
ncbi:hypothetical protein OEZ85_011289 [Tetradesmus obliquus]|uniref:NADPH--hemoprotein reductase n=1 Tax=Tetradesmus obliquus TaxID=3088 RepID=A0ABY8TQ91_TETOB|nr:hypothetical protein OEZ85_011289 [Tetradesmus obliquus]